MSKIVFPSFSGQVFSSAEMRQLVSAIDLRFQQLESATQESTIPSTDVETEYASIDHTHVEANITDLGDYLTDITAESIFDLSDVVGTPSGGQTLVWTGSAFQPQSVVGVSELDDLTDVTVTAPSDEDILRYNTVSGQWENVASSDVEVLTDLTDVDTSATQKYDLLNNYDGYYWIPTYGELIWNRDLDFLQLANSHSINWLASDGTTSTELLMFDYVGTVSEPTEYVHYEDVKTNYASTSSQTYVDTGNLDVAQTAFNNGDEVFINHFALVYNDNSSTSESDGYRLIADGAALFGAQMEYEGWSDTGAGVAFGSAYGYSGWFTANTAGANIKSQHKRGNAGSTVNVVAENTLLINLTSDAPNHVKDRSSTLTNVWATYPSYVTTDTAITIGAGDWLVFGCARHEALNRNTHGDTHLGIRVGGIYPATGNTNDEIDIAFIPSEDEATDNIVLSGGFILDGYAGGTLTLIATGGQGSGSSTANLSHKSIIAIPLSDFRSYWITQANDTNRSLPDLNTNTINTINATITNTANYVAIGFCGLEHITTTQITGYGITENVNSGGRTLIGFSDDVNQRGYAGTGGFSGQTVSASTTYVSGNSVVLEQRARRKGSPDTTFEYRSEGLALIEMNTVANNTEIFTVGDPSHITDIDASKIRVDNQVGINYIDALSTDIEVVYFDSAADQYIGNVVLLIDAESASNGATSVTSSVGGHTFNAVTNGVGVAEVSNLQAKFGSNSLRCDDEAGAVAAYWKPAATSDDFFFGSGDWTVEFHIYLTGNRTTTYQIGRFANSGPEDTDWAWTIGISSLTNNDFRTEIALSSNGDTNFTIPNGGTFHWDTGATNDGGSLNTWYHIAVSRVGNFLYVFTNGDLLSNNPPAAPAGVDITGFTMYSPTNKLIFIGDSKDLPATGGPVQENFYDNIRITKGTGRYTTDFTEPAAPYSATAASTFTLGDPTVDNLIDGSDTTIDSTLTVTGAATFQSTTDHFDGSTWHVQTGISPITIDGDIGDTTTPLIDILNTGTNVDRRLIRFREEANEGFYIDGDFSLSNPNNALIIGTDIVGAVGEMLWMKQDGDWRFGTDRVVYDYSARLLDMPSTDIDLGNAGFGDRINFYGGLDGALSASIGNESTIDIFLKAAQVHRWYVGTNADLGASNYMYLNVNELGLERDIDLFQADAATATHSWRSAWNSPDYDWTFTGTTDLNISGLTGEVIINPDLRATGDFTVDSTAALINLFDNDATLDEKSWLIVNSADQFRIETAADATPKTAVEAALRIERSGTAVSSVNFDNGTVVITDDLTVNGTTTTINSNTVAIADNIILLNSDEAGAPTQNAGIEVERGTSTNVLLRYNETTDRWEFTNDGSTYYNLMEMADGTVTNNTLRWDGSNWVETSLLQVDDPGGNHVITSTLDEATGDEIALDLSYTVNKATSGADTGLRLNVTETSSPGTSLFAEYVAGGVTKFSWSTNPSFTMYDNDGTDSVAMGLSGGLTPNRVFSIDTTNTDYVDITGIVSPGGLRLRDGARFEIYDATDTNYLVVNHDGTDVNWTGVNTTDFIVDGLTWFKILGGGGLAIYDSTNADEVNFSHDGTYFNINTVTTDAIRIAESTWITGGNQFRIYDSSGLDYGVFSHDGTDFNTVFTTTTAWAIDGLTNIQFENQIRTYWYSTGNTESTAARQDVNSFDWDYNGHTLVNHLSPSPVTHDFRDGATIRIRDAGDTDYADFSHDGTDFNTAFTTTDEWNITGANAYNFNRESLGVTTISIGEPITLRGDTQDSAIQMYAEQTGVIYGAQISVYSSNIGLQGITGNPVTTLQQSLNHEWRGGRTLTLFDATDTDSVQFSHNGTNLVFNATNTTGLNLANFGGGVRVLDGAYVRIYDSTDTDYATFSHDGTDFNTAFTTTTDWNITGITAIQAGTVDADFDAITATSYGGILEANLLDKTASETVSGSYTFSTRPILTATGGGAMFEGTAPGPRWHETDAPADEGEWWMVADGGGISLRAYNDAFAAYDLVMAVYRTGQTVDEVNFYTDTNTERLSVDSLGINVTGDVSGTTIGGITEANLLDKTATETVSGAYTFTGGVVIDNGPTNNVLRGGASDADNLAVLFGNSYDSSLVPYIRGWGSADISGNANYLQLSVPNTGTIQLTANTAGSVQLASPITSFTGTGLTTFTVGNYDFDVDQVLGAGQDGYVLTYTNGTGEISFTAAGTGTVTSATGADNRVAVFTSATNIEGDASFTWDSSTASLTLFDTLDTDSFVIQQTTGDTKLQSTQHIWLSPGTGGHMAYVYRSGSQAPFRVYDGTGNDYWSISHDGTNVNTIFAGTNDWDIISLTNGIRLRDGAYFRVYDSGDTDYASFSHDGTDFNTTFVTTTAWNMGSGLTAIRYLSGLASADFQVGRNANEHLTFQCGDGDGSITYTQDEVDATAHRLLFNVASSNTGGRGFAFQDNGVTKFEIDHLNDLVWVRDGYGFRIYDSTDTDYGHFSHDGTDFNTTFATTTAWNITGATIDTDDRVIIRGAAVGGDEGSSLVINTSNPQFSMDTPSGAANEKVWNWIADAGGTYRLRTLDDTYGAGEDIFTIDRTGTTVDTFTFNNGNVVITDNLTVNGTTTTINSNTVSIADNIIVLNSDEAGAPTANAGIEVERGTSANVQFYWNETNDRWQIDAGGLYLNNTNLTAVNHIVFNDSGPGEGLQWENWQIYDSPNDLATNTAGNLQFVNAGVREATLETDGRFFARGGFSVPYTAATKVPVITLETAENYGLFHTEGTPDIFSFDHGGTARQSFYGDGDVIFTGSLDLRGLTFGSVLASSATDLSDHIALWGTTYGFNITSGNINVVANGTNTLSFVSSSSINSKVNHDFAAGIDVTGNITTTADIQLTGEIQETNHGRTGNQSLEPQWTLGSDWYNLDVGYHAFVRNTTGTAGGAPVNNYGYFHMVAHRDTSNGWGGLWVGYTAGENYMGRSSAGGFATWDKLACANLTETISGVWTHSANMVLQDNVNLYLGTGNDTRFYFNATDLYLDMADGADFRVRGGTGTTESMIVAESNAAVTTYYNGTAKAATNTNGFEVYGTVTVATPPTTYTGTAQLSFYDSDGTDELMALRTTTSGGRLELVNRVHGAQIQLSGENASGTNQVLFRADPDGSAELYYTNTIALRTADETAADLISGAEVLDAEGNLKPVGLGVIIDDSTSFGTGTQTPFQQINAHQTIDYTNGTATTFNTYASTGASQTDIPAGAQWEVKNDGAGALTIGAGTSVTLKWWDGGAATPPTGNRTLARGGRCVVRKISDTEYDIWGIGLT